MDKSIEKIWKEGFLEKDALIAPKLNDLYNQKSKHIIDKFKRMFTINLWAIVIGALVVLIVSYFTKVPIMGINLFLILFVVTLINRKLMAQLKTIDKGESSYDYLKSFNGWLKYQLAINRKMARIYYPLILLGTVLGILYSEQGNLMLTEIVSSNPDIQIILGLPIFIFIPLLIASLLLAIFGGRIYNLDISTVYGNIIKKLNELLNDMEELRA